MKLHQGHFLITVDTLTKTISLIDAKVKCCCVCVCVRRGSCLGVMRGLQCQTDASENWSRGSLIFIDMSKLILIRIWIAMDCMKQQYNREVLKNNCGQRVTLLDRFFDSLILILFVPIQRIIRISFFSFFSQLKMNWDKQCNVLMSKSTRIHSCLWFHLYTYIQYSSLSCESHASPKQLCFQQIHGFHWTAINIPILYIDIQKREKKTFKVDQICLKYSLKFYKCKGRSKNITKHNLIGNNYI